MDFIIQSLLCSVLRGVDTEVRVLTFLEEFMNHPYSWTVSEALLRDAHNEKGRLEIDTFQLFLVNIFCVDFFGEFTFWMLGRWQGHVLFRRFLFALKSISSYIFVIALSYSNLLKDVHSLHESANGEIVCRNLKRFHCQTLLRRLL